MLKMICLKGNSCRISGKFKYKIYFYNKYELNNKQAYYYSEEIDFINLKSPGISYKKGLLLDYVSYTGFIENLNLKKGTFIEINL